MVLAWNGVVPIFVSASGVSLRHGRSADAAASVAAAAAVAGGVRAAIASQEVAARGPAAVAARRLRRPSAAVAEPQARLPRSTRGTPAGPPPATRRTARRPAPDPACRPVRSPPAPGAAQSGKRCRRPRRGPHRAGPRRQVGLGGRRCPVSASPSSAWTTGTRQASHPNIGRPDRPGSASAGYGVMPAGICLR